mmetsp:Transcript_49540/g.139438  ORF Transcript_49540/g.139438 Transcript_49540/m.139438 type:complete len:272 (-) Transcript_49540:274-1089(-)
MDEAYAAVQDEAPWQVWRHREDEGSRDQVHRRPQLDQLADPDDDTLGRVREHLGAGQRRREARADSGHRRGLQAAVHREAGGWGRGERRGLNLWQRRPMPRRRRRAHLPAVHLRPSCWRRCRLDGPLAARDDLGHDGHGSATACAGACRGWARRRAVGTAIVCVAMRGHRRRRLWLRRMRSKPRARCAALGRVPCRIVTSAGGNAVCCGVSEGRDVEGRRGSALGGGGAHPGADRQVGLVVPLRLVPVLRALLALRLLPLLPALAKLRLVK